MDNRSDVTVGTKIRSVLSTRAFSDETVVVVEERPPSRATREWDHHHYVVTLFVGDRVAERRYTASIELLGPIADGMVFEHQRRSTARGGTSL